MRQAENLYLREDVILGWIFAQLDTLASRDAAVQEHVASLGQDRIVVDLARFLRTRNTTIVCRPTGISLEPDHENTIIVSALANTQSWR